MLPKGGPDAVLKRAQVRRVAEMVNSGIQPLQNLSPMAKITAESGGAYDGKAFGKDALPKYVFCRYARTDKGSPCICVCMVLFSCVG